MIRNLTRTLAIALLTTGFALACGGSEEEKMERGLAVDDEMAVPDAGAEYEMTDAERQAKIDAEDRKKETEEFDEEAAQ